MCTGPRALESPLSEANQAAGRKTGQHGTANKARRQTERAHTKHEQQWPFVPLCPSPLLPRVRHCLALALPWLASAVVPAAVGSRLCSALCSLFSVGGPAPAGHSNGTPHRKQKREEEKKASVHPATDGLLGRGSERAEHRLAAQAPLGRENSDTQPTPNNGTGRRELRTHRRGADGAHSNRECTLTSLVAVLSVRSSQTVPSPLCSLPLPQPPPWPTTT